MAKLAASFSSSDLHKYLVGEMHPADLKVRIGDRVSEFKKALSKIGASAPIQIETEGELFIVGKDQLLRLCDEYLQGNLTEFEIYYLASALELSADFIFASKIVEESVFLLANPDINGALTSDHAQEIKHMVL